MTDRTAPTATTTTTTTTRCPWWRRRRRRRLRAPTTAALLAILFLRPFPAVASSPAASPSSFPALIPAAAAAAVGAEKSPRSAPRILDDDGLRRTVPRPRRRTMRVRRRTPGAFDDGGEGDGDEHGDDGELGGSSVNALADAVVVGAVEGEGDGGGAAGGETDDDGSGGGGPAATDNRVGTSAGRDGDGDGGGGEVENEDSGGSAVLIEVPDGGDSDGDGATAGTIDSGGSSMGGGGEEQEDIYFAQDGEVISSEAPSVPFGSVRSTPLSYDHFDVLRRSPLAFPAGGLGGSQLVRVPVPPDSEGGSDGADNAAAGGGGGGGAGEGEDPPHRRHYDIVHLSAFLGLTRGPSDPSGTVSDGSTFAAIMAVHHWNNGVSDVVPAIAEARREICPDLRITAEFFDTEFSPYVAAKRLIGTVLERIAVEKEDGGGDNDGDSDDGTASAAASPRRPRAVPLALVGSSSSVVSATLAAMTSSRRIPQLSHAATSSQFESGRDGYDLFGRLIPSNTAGDAGAAASFFSDRLSATHVAVLFVRDEYGSEYANAFRRRGSELNLTVALASFSGVGPADPAELRESIGRLKKTQYRYFLGLFFSRHYVDVVTEASNQGVTGPEYLWMFGDAVLEDLNAVEFPAGSAVAEATNGVGIVHIAPPVVASMMGGGDGGRAPDGPSEFVRHREEMFKSREARAYLARKVAEHGVSPASPRTDARSRRRRRRRRMRRGSAEGQEGGGEEAAAAATAGVARGSRTRPEEGPGHSGDGGGASSSAGALEGGSGSRALQILFPVLVASEAVDCEFNLPSGIRDGTVLGGYAEVAPFLDLDGGCGRGENKEGIVDPEDTVYATFNFAFLSDSAAAVVYNLCPDGVDVPSANLSVRVYDLDPHQEQPLPCVDGGEVPCGGSFVTDLPGGNYAFVVGDGGVGSTAAAVASASAVSHHFDFFCLVTAEAPEVEEPIACPGEGGSQVPILVSFLPEDDDGDGVRDVDCVDDFDNGYFTDLYFDGKISDGSAAAPPFHDPGSCFSGGGTGGSIVDESARLFTVLELRFASGMSVDVGRRCDDWEAPNLSVRIYKRGADGDYMTCVGGGEVSCAFGSFVFLARPGTYAFVISGDGAAADDDFDMYFSCVEIEEDEEEVVLDTRVRFVDCSEDSPSGALEGTVVGGSAEVAPLFDLGGCGSRGEEGDFIFIDDSEDSVYTAFHFEFVSSSTVAVVRNFCASNAASSSVSVRVYDLASGEERPDCVDGGEVECDGSFLADLLAGTYAFVVGNGGSSASASAGSHHFEFLCLLEDVVPAPVPFPPVLEDDSEGSGLPVPLSPVPEDDDGDGVRVVDCYDNESGYYNDLWLEGRISDGSAAPPPFHDPSSSCVGGDGDGIAAFSDEGGESTRYMLELNFLFLTFVDVGAVCGDDSEVDGGFSVHVYERGADGDYATCVASGEVSCRSVFYMDAAPGTYAFVLSGVEDGAADGFYFVFACVELLNDEGGSQVSEPELLPDGTREVDCGDHDLWLGDTLSDDPTDVPAAIFDQGLCGRGTDDSSNGGGEDGSFSVFELRFPFSDGQTLVDVYLLCGSGDESAAVSVSIYERVADDGDALTCVDSGEATCDSPFYIGLSNGTYIFVVSSDANSTTDFEFYFSCVGIASDSGGSSLPDGGPEDGSPLPPIAEDEPPPIAEDEPPPTAEDEPPPIAEDEPPPPPPGDSGGGSVGTDGKARQIVGSGGGSSMAKTPSPFEFLMYDTIISMALSACSASHAGHLFDPDYIYESFLRNTSFDGASGRVEIDPETGSRDFRTVSYAVSNLVAVPSRDDDTARFEVRISDIYTPSLSGEEDPAAEGGWSAGRGGDFVFHDGTADPPDNLPKTDVSLISLSNGARIFGLALCGCLILLSFGFGVWTAVHRKTAVIKASQPFFLHIVCGGTFLMALTIIPLSITYADTSNQRLVDVMCMAGPWLFQLGFVTAFSAMFSKLMRVVKLFKDAARFTRVTVNVKDVMKPFVFLFTLTLALLISWTVVAPLRFTSLKTNSIDEFGRVNSEIQICYPPPGRRTQAVAFSLTLTAIDIVVLCIANFQAYQARNISVEYSESRYIGLGMAIMAEGFLIGIPVMVTVPFSPTPQFIVRSLLVAVVCCAAMLPLFVPKVIFMKEHIKKKEEKERRRRQRMSRLQEFDARCRQGGGTTQPTQPFTTNPPDTSTQIHRLTTDSTDVKASAMGRFSYTMDSARGIGHKSKISASENVRNSVPM